jgi:inorganic triphosphatase YgiF
MSQEVELKLGIAPGDVPQVLDHPLLSETRQGAFQAQPLVSVYYDTPPLDLQRRGIAVRLRQQGARWIQTVKAYGKGAGGLHDRREEEQETAENRLDFDALRDAQLRTVFAAEQLRRALRPLFKTEVTRTSALLAFPNGDRLELAVDQGEIRAGENTLPVSEIELERKAGHASRVFDVALRLQETIPLQVEYLSKADRGYRLVTQAPLRPGKSTEPPLSEEFTTGEAFGAILRACLTQVQANAEGVLHGNDPEFTQQMRVALRRLRSVLSLFKALVPKAHTAPLREELRWLSGELDAARNWDVFHEQILPPILAAFPENADLQSFATQSADRRRAQDRRAQDAVRAQRYHRLLLHFGAWLYTQSWQTDVSEERTVAPELPVAEFAEQLLRERHKQLRRDGDDLPTLSASQRHRVRIAAKKLRYGVDFFAALFPHKQVRRYLKALTALQDVLGELNDATTATGLVQELALVAEPGGQQEACRTVLGWVQGTSYVRVQDLEQIWETFLDCKRFW